jgi:hypothetical protein
VADGASPPGVVVSFVSARLRNPMPRSASRCRPGGAATASAGPASIPSGCRRGGELVQDLLAGGAVGAGAAGDLGEHPVTAGALKGVVLEVGLLVGCGDSERSRADAPWVAEPCDRPGRATLFVDTGSGHVCGPWRWRSSGCRSNVAGLNGWLHHLRTDG